MACTRAALWQAGKRPVEPLQLKGLESEGECAALQDDTQQEKSVPIPWKEAGMSSEGNERYLTKKQKQTSPKPVSTTMSKTLHKREPEIWKSI